MSDKKQTTPKQEPKPTTTQPKPGVVITKPRELDVKPDKIRRT